MTRALIGHTGFVGGNLRHQLPFDEFYNSSNIEEIAGKQFSLLVCSGAPAEKWRANQDPATDRANLVRLQRCLGAVRADRFVLISTIDVFKRPVDVQEHTPLDIDGLHPYGLHRHQLEAFCRDHFAAATSILRLPGLFGRGLKKNAIFDLLSGNDVSKLDPEAVYQFYDLSQLSRDLKRAQKLGLALLHLATEPLRLAEVAELLIGRPLTQPSPPPPHPLYRFESSHAWAWGKSGPFLYDGAEVRASLVRFATEFRAGRAHP